MVMRGGSAVAESSTGARNRNANGFSRPPVRNSSTASSAMSKASSQAARSGSSRCVRLKRTPQRDVEPGRQRDHREAGPDRQRELERVVDHQHGGGLADDREPAQPQQRVEPHVSPLRQMQYVGGVVEHGAYLSAPRRCSQCCQATHGAVRRAARFGACAGPRAASHLRVMLAPATDSPIAVDRLVKRYKAVTAVDGISFAIAAGSFTALLGGNGAGKTTTIAMHHGPGRRRPRARVTRARRRRCRAQRHRVLHRMNFESPYVEHADAAHGAAEPERVRHALRLRGRRRPHRARWPTSSTCTTSSTARPASCRPARRPAWRSPRR